MREESHLSLRLLVDECLMSKLLISKLIELGHDVQTVAQANLMRTLDSVIFDYAVAANRVVITGNCGDFIELSDICTAAGGHHPGVLLIFTNNDRSKNMSVDDIIKALGNLEATGLALDDHWISLGSYNY
jgi:predicted nuclease of predicted toxin-antitoxin system